jgi:hypothetical protein
MRTELRSVVIAKMGDSYSVFFLKSEDAKSPIIITPHGQYAGYCDVTLFAKGCAEALGCEVRLVREELCAGDSPTSQMRNFQEWWAAHPKLEETEEI